MPPVTQPRLLIIADDLTGANDAGVQFARRGIPTLVRIGAGRLTDLAGQYPVLVVSTESRHANPAIAARRVAEVVREGVEAGIEFFYKKTDSSLRGNIGSELEAVMQATGQRSLWFTPAWPKLRRTTRQGYLYVDGVPLDQTAFARDPLNPVTDGFLPAIIGRQTRIPAIAVRPGEALQAEGGPVIYILDAETDADLEQAVLWLATRGLPTALAGSGGLAEKLPEVLGFATSPVPRQRLPARLLVVNGSLNEVSLNQVAEAAKQELKVITLAPEVLIPAEGVQSREAEPVIGEIREQVEAGRSTILSSCAVHDAVSAYLALGRSLGLSTHQIHRRVARNLGQLARHILSQTDVNLIGVFGGDTLMALAQALGWRGLLPREEILPGVVLSETVGGTHGLRVLSKAGGFGPAELLMQIQERLGR